MRIATSKRGRTGAKRLDLSDIRAVLADRRVWCVLGVVADPGDGSAHYELVTDVTGALVDILVEVDTVPDQVPVSARLGGRAGAGRGQWSIPEIGDEVIVALPAGQLDFQPAIVEVLSSGSIPNPPGQGPAQGRTIIVDGQVFVHDGAGVAVPLTTHPDMQALAEVLDNWVVAAGDGGAALKTLIQALLNTGWPSGTQVLKAQ